MGAARRLADAGERLPAAQGVDGAGLAGIGAAGEGDFTALIGRRLPQAGGAGEKIKLMWQRHADGDRLTGPMRADLAAAATDILDAQLKTQVLLEDEYRRTAGLAGIPAAQVIVDFIGEGRPVDEEAGETETESSDSGPKFYYDLSGKKIEKGSADAR